MTNERIKELAIGYLETTLGVRPCAQHARAPADIAELIADLRSNKTDCTWRVELCARAANALEWLVTPSSADVRNAALEEAARIADRHVAADQELQNRAVDPQMVTIAILTGRIIARDIRALALPDSKPDNQRGA